MAKKWAEIESSSQFMALAPDQQAAVKTRFFESRIAPAAPPERVGELRERFLGASAPRLAAAVPGAPASQGLVGSALKSSPATDKPSADRPSTSADTQRTWGEFAQDTSTGIGQGGLGMISGVARAVNARSPGVTDVSERTQREYEEAGGIWSVMAPFKGASTALASELEFRGKEALGAVGKALGDLVPDSMGGYMLRQNAEQRLDRAMEQRAAQPESDRLRSGFAEAFAQQADDYAARVPEVQSQKARQIAKEMGELSNIEGFGEQAGATVDYFASPFLRGDFSTGGARVSKVMESLIPSLAAGGGAARITRGAGPLAEKASQFGTMTMMEAGGAGEGARQQVLALELDALQAVPEFQAAMRMTGGDPERARMLLADQAASIANTVGAATSAATMGAGELIGANVAEKAVREGVLSLGTAGGLKAAAGNIAGSTAKEFGSEFLQGASNQVSQNLGTVAVGAESSLGRGVVSAGLMEGIAGAGSGAAATAGGEVAKRLRPLQDGEDLLGGENVQTGDPGAGQPGGLNIPDDPSAAPITTAQIQTLREQQLNALIAKRDGLPDQEVIDSVSGKPVVVRGQPAQVLSDAEKRLLEFLQKFSERPDVLARALGGRLDDSAEPAADPAAPGAAAAAPSIEPAAPSTPAAAPNIEAPAPSPVAPPAGPALSALRPQNDLLLAEAAEEISGIDNPNPAVAGPIATNPQPGVTQNAEETEEDREQVAGRQAGIEGRSGREEAGGRQAETGFGIPGPAGSPDRQLDAPQRPENAADVGAEVSPQPTGVVAGALAARPTAEALAEDSVEGQPLPERSESPAAVSPRAPDSFIPQIMQEFGWSQIGGRLIRDPSTAIDPMEQIEPDGTSGDVVARTTWIGKPDAFGGESNFWRHRPGAGEKGGSPLSQKEATAAIEKWRQGRKLGARQQAFIDYMQRAAKEYSERWNAEIEQQERDFSELEEEGIALQSEALRDESEPVSAEDERRALTLEQLVLKAADLGATKDEIIALIEQNPEPRDYTRAIWHYIENRSGQDATNEEASAGGGGSGLQEEGGRPDVDAGRGEGGAGEAEGGAAEAGELESGEPEDQAPRLTLSAPAAPPAASAPRPMGAQGGLFAPPTRKEIIDGERRRRDAERNGEAAAGRTDMMAGDGELFAGPRPEQIDVEQAIAAERAQESDRAPLENATAPEHVRTGPGEQQTGVTVAELKQIAAEFREYIDAGKDAAVTRIFDAPKKSDIVRLQDKVKVHVAGKGWMALAEARAEIRSWEDNAVQQGKDSIEGKNQNSQKVVLSLFDLSGEWSLPWEQAGYQVFRFDIQDGNTYTDPETGEERKLGDVHNMSVEFFNDLFGSFDGMDVHAILAACPCTDFAVSGARHFAAKDADGRTVSSVELVKKTLAAIEYFKPAVWAVENPVGRIEQLTGLPPWRLSFDPNHLGDPYTKKTLIWGRFNANLPVAPVEPTEGSMMHKKFGGKSLKTKNARSVTPEGFAYAFFQANNAVDNPMVALAGKYDRLELTALQRALDAGLSESEIADLIDDLYYMDLDDDAANQALRDAAQEVQQDRVAAAASQAAASPTNDRPEPTEAQKEAGNYKKGPLSLHGLRISIENPAGTRRRPEWPELAHHYGYIRGTEGKDGDHVDVFIGPDAENAELSVFVIDQVTQAGRFDEHKVMMGFADEAAARAGYLANYSPGWSGLGDITQMSLADFKAWVMDSARTSKQASADAAAAAEAAPIRDFGEKIGGARKDTALPTGARGKSAREAEDDRPTWAKRYEISQIITGSDPEDVGNWTIRDKRVKDRMGQKKQVGERAGYATREEAEAALPLIELARNHRITMSSRAGGDREFLIVRSVTDRKYVVLKNGFASRDEAMRYMVENPVELIETKTSFGEIDLPLPPSRERRGEARRDRDVRDSDFSDVFGFRGVEFGKWNNQAERQELLNDAYDGLIDLADVLGIPPRAISLGGELALAFGARGHGLSGARAHYEPERPVINLTKENGAGSLAHEWMHALDHYLWRRGNPSVKWKTNPDGTRSLELRGNDFDLNSMSGGTARDNVRPEIRELFKKLNATMSRKAVEYVNETSKVEAWVAKARDQVKSELDSLRDYLARPISYAKRNNKPATAEQLAEFDTLAERILTGRDVELRAESPPKSRKGSYAVRWTNDSINSLSAIMKAVRGREGFSSDKKGQMDRIASYVRYYGQRLDEMNKANEGETQVKAVPTDFKQAAVSLDQGRTGDYWTLPSEMLARAFQGYVQDKIAEREGFSPFLNYGPENAVIPSPWGFVAPYPRGAERKAINAVFDELFGTLEVTDEGDGKIGLREDGATYGEATAVQAGSERAGVAARSAPAYNGQGAPAPLQGGQLDLFLPEPAVERERARFANRAVPVQIGAFRSGVRVVNGPEDAAHIIAPLRKSPQEKMMALVLDVERRPLAVIQHALGEVDGASVEPWSLLGAIAQVKGVRSVYFAHNHPSGMVDQSRADKAITTKLRDIMRGSGIEPMGMLTVGPDSRVAGFQDNGDPSSEVPITAAVRRESVPVMERSLRKVMRGAGRVITDELSAVDAIKATGLESGILLLSTRHGVIGALEVDPAEGERLRSGNPETGSMRVLSAVSEANASAVMVFGEEKAAMNMAGMLNMAGLRVLDRMYRRPGSKVWVSAAATHKSIVDFGRFFSRPRLTESREALIDQSQPGDRIPMGPLRSEAAIRFAVAAALDGWRGQKPIVRVVKTATELPADAKSGDGWQEADGYFDGADGVWLVAENLPSIDRAMEVLRHEAVGHFGVERIAAAEWPQILAGIAALRGQKRNGLSKPMAAALAEAEARYPDAAENDPTLFAKELIAILSESDTRASFMDRMVAAVRRFLRRAGLIGEDFSEAEIRRVLSGAFRLVERGDITAGAPVAAAGMASIRPDDVAAYILRTMAQNDADLFLYPKSEGKKFTEVMRDVTRGEITAVRLGETTANFTEDVLDVQPAVRWGLRTPDGATVFVYVEKPGPKTPASGPRLYIDASQANAGASKGSAIYAALFQWALNTGHVFIGDPNGLTTEALLRRTEHMLSAALKHGTTRMMEPHARQIDPRSFGRLGPGQSWAHPLEWTDGDDVGNITSLIRTSVENLRGLMEGTDGEGAVYRVSDGVFVGAGGEALTDAGLRRIAAQAGERFRRSGRFVAGESRAAAIGGATIARALVLKTISDGSRGTAGERRELLAELAKRLASQRLTYDAARRRFYSRPAALATAARVASSAGTTGRAAVLALRQRAQNLLKRDVLDRLLYEFQDKFVDLKRIQAHIREVGGTVNDLNDAYLGEELFHSRVMARHETFLDNELKPLLAELNAGGIAVEDFERYLHARHAPEANRVLADRNPDAATVQTETTKAQAAVAALRAQLGQAQAAGSATFAIQGALDQAEQDLARWKRTKPFKGTAAERQALSGMSDADAAAYIGGLDPATATKMAQAAARVDAINAKTLDTLQQYGLMEKSALDAWRQTYQHYVPLHRDEAHPEKSSHPTGSGFSVRGDASKTRTGSANAKVTHILAHIAMQREAAITRGEKNNVAKKLYLLAGQNPDPNLWEIDTPPTIQKVDPVTGTVATYPDPTFRQKPNVVSVRIKGKDRAIVFNERNPRALRLAESMKNLDADDLHVVLGWFAKATRWLASVNTQYNPVFGIINLIRDTQGVALQLSTTALAGRELEVVKRIPAMLRSIYRERRGKGARSPEDARLQRLWSEMQAAGGVTGYRDLFRDPMERAKAIQSEIDKLSRGATSRVAHAIVDWLSDYNEAIENATRLAVYERALAQGLTKDRAASLAKNITVNFNRKGRQARELGSLFAFFNAAVQGTARMAETLAGPKGRAIMAGGVLVGFVNTLIGMLVMGGDDDDWSKIPAHVKERAVIIPISGKDYISIPMPLGYHVFPNLGRIAAEWAFGGPEQGFADNAGELLRIGADAFNPLGGSSTPLQMLMPTALDPVAALAENTDWTGRQIYREDFRSTDPTPGFTRAKDSASTPSRVLSWLANAATGGDDYEPGAFSPTPDQIDYVIGQLTGGLGREILKAQTTLAAPFNDDELPAYKVPLVSRLYGNTRGTAGESERFYENLRDLNVLERRIKGEARRGEDVSALIEDEPLAGLVVMGSRAESVISRLRAAERQAKAAGDTERAKELRERITETMRQVNRAATEAKQ